MTRNRRLTVASSVTSTATGSDGVVSTAAPFKGLYDDLHGGFGGWGSFKKGKDGALNVAERLEAGMPAFSEADTISSAASSSELVEDAETEVPDVEVEVDHTAWYTDLQNASPDGTRRRANSTARRTLSYIHLRRSLQRTRGPADPAADAPPPPLTRRASVHVGSRPSAQWTGRYDPYASYLPPPPAQEELSARRQMREARRSQQREAEHFSVTRCRQPRSPSAGTAASASPRAGSLTRDGGAGAAGGSATGTPTWSYSNRPSASPSPSPSPSPRRLPTRSATPPASGRRVTREWSFSSKARLAEKAPPSRSSSAGRRGAEPLRPNESFTSQRGLFHYEPSLSRAITSKPVSAAASLSTSPRPLVRQRSLPSSFASASPPCSPTGLSPAAAPATPPARFSPRPSTTGRRLPSLGRSR